jgi:protein-disulfide isomerase
MAKKTVEFELPELSDKTLMYVLAGAILLAQVSTAYFTLQANQSIIALSDAVTKLELNAPSNPTPTPSPQPTPQQPTVVNVSPDDDAPRGSPSAPVKIIVFSDYQCPYCARVEPAITQVMDTYKDKVVVYFRDYPLPFHENAQKAAEAAECAGEQGKYWEMHDKLFENQAALDAASLKKYATDLGLDATVFNTCLDTGAMAAEVGKDLSDGQAAGVEGTPTAFINGKAIVGAQPFTAFKALIDAELA